MKNKNQKPGTELKADGKRFYPLHSTNGSVLCCNIAFEFITKFIKVCPVETHHIWHKEKLWEKSSKADKFVFLAPTVEKLSNKGEEPSDN